MTRPGLPLADGSIVREITTFAEAHHLAERAAEIDRKGEFPRAEFRALGRAGLLGLRVPSALGGRGLRLRHVGAALFHLAYLGGTAFAKLSLQPEFSSVLAEQGGKELVERYFRPMMRGEMLVGNQLTEPSAGSDLSAISLSARRESDHYVLDGVKSEAAFAAEADAAIVYARVSGPPPVSPGLTALLVPQDLAGVRRTVVGDMGERWMRRGTVAYRSVEVPLEHRLGAEGKALEYVRPELTRERALLSAIYLGVARASWDETVEHVRTRTAFGGPLSEQEAVAFPLVEDQARLDAAWLYVDRVLQLMDEGAEVTADAALAKWLATETALEAIDHAVQFNGGRGYSSALPHERRWRDVRSGAIAHGTNEVMHRVASRALWPRERTSGAAPRPRPPKARTPPANR